MPDGDGSSVGSKIFGSISEAIAQPVKEHLEVAFDEAIGSITGKYTTPTDPQEAAKKQQEEALKKQQEDQKKANIRIFLSQFQTDEQRFLAQKQREAQEKNAKQQEDQEKSQKKKQEFMQKQQTTASLNESSRKGKAEIKGGVGG